MSDFEKIKKTIDKYDEKMNLVGFFKLLWDIDKRVNSQLYENIGNTNSPDQAE